MTRLSRTPSDTDITSLLDQASADLPLAERHLWLVQVMTWIRAGEPVSGVQYILRQLAQDPQRREGVVGLLGAFWRDIDVTSLLTDFGFSSRTSFLHELGERLRGRLLPLTPATRDLGTLFALLFDDPADVHWLEQLDSAMLDDLAALWSEGLVRSEAATSPLGWRRPFVDAIQHLAGQVRAAGSSRELRVRMGSNDIQLAFRHLASSAEQLAERAELAQANPDDKAAHAALLQEAQYLRALLDSCQRHADGIHEHLEEHGISIDIVFQIDQLKQRCERIELLLLCVLSPQPAGALRNLVVDLVEVSTARRSVRALFRQHYSMLARKVAERSAETGEHYITRTRAEYLDMLWRAAGGGVVLAFTTFLKFAVFALGLSPFWTGLGAGANYAVSFVVVQLLHFTVATKQPAMTAPAMAARLADTRSDAAIESFVDEVAHLIRSQMAGILGNLLLVAPVVLGMQALSWWLMGHPLINEHKAEHTLHSLTLLGPTLWYAAFTGVLLFASSLIAGWLENWFVLHRLDSALQWNPRIRRLVGPQRAAWWAQWWRQNISGLGANISLGLMLGLVPMFASFFALPLDVRHVTLSTGQVAAALGTLGWPALHDAGFWWCVAALPLTGVLNVGVSFLLALRVAMRSRDVHVQDRARLRKAVWRRVWRHPLSFLLPPRG
ncbi:site-specific recombinase [Aquabacterium sp.]|uniref:site-specific recombinase n=1 Tax=Aquabacterium sp. TaxID=1872578 RepID=UPI0035AEC5DC